MPKAKVHKRHKKSLTADVELLWGKSYGVKVLMAHDLQSSVKLLRLLAADQDVVVRQEVGANPVIPPDLMRELLLDNRWVRQGVARNVKAPPDIMKQLAEDDEWTVRQYIATNPSAPIALLKQLSTDTSSMVRYLVTKNKHTPIGVLRALVKDEDVIVSKYAQQALADQTH